ncbi:flavin reductase family protein [Cyclobacterium amurskyense]|uniref:flavin reductase family protein n=1 Tax=Cyclobacterium amurskyense TaxID=320787 RepID=UPI0030D9FE9B|tara:strand:- start:54340 stop:54969 length:630 start_codon:yes stop_codon:yes gene_type:complete
MKHFTKEALLTAGTAYNKNFINCLSGYKSLNLIGSINEESSETNLAPFSQVFHIGANPPTVGILFRPHSVERHTLENILQNGHFTLNHVTESFYKEAHLSSARWERSEFEATGLKEEYLNNFIAPFVEKSPLKVACLLKDKITLAVNETVLIIGSIEEVWIKPQAVEEDGFISLDKLGTITVSGLDSYHIANKLARLTYAKPDKPVKEL